MLIAELSRAKGPLAELHTYGTMLFIFHGHGQRNVSRARGDTSFSEVTTWEAEEVAEGLNGKGNYIFRCKFMLISIYD